MRAKSVKIVLDGFGYYLGRDRGCLIVRDKDRKEKRYPLFDNELGQIEVRSGNFLSSTALTTCGFWDIDVIFETSRGHPVAILKSLYDDSHVLTRVCQYEALKNGTSLEIAKALVLAKLEGQDQVLKKYGLRKIDYSFMRAVKSLDISDVRILRRKLMYIEGKCSTLYFSQVFGLFNEPIRPKNRKTYKAYDGLNNLFSLAYRVLFWKVHIALIKAKLEPYLGFLHGIILGRASLICDFLELYRYLMDDFVIGYARRLTSKDFSLKAEEYSSTRKGTRQYLNDTVQSEFMKRLNDYFRTRVDIPRIMRGEHQEIETLISEEALLFAMYLRNERRAWNPRIVELS